MEEREIAARSLLFKISCFHTNTRRLVQNYCQMNVVKSPETDQFLTMRAAKCFNDVVLPDFARSLGDMFVLDLPGTGTAAKITRAD